MPSLSKRTAGPHGDATQASRSLSGPVRVCGQFPLKIDAGLADEQGVAYSTDVTDAQWALLEPLLGWGLRGPRPGLDRRGVVNAVLYQARTGCQWRLLPVGELEQHLEGLVPVAGAGRVATGDGRPAPTCAGGRGS